MRTAETVTQALHRLTSFPPEPNWDDGAIDVRADPRLVQNLEVLDLARVPWPYKRYEQSLPRLELPVELPSTTAAALAVLGGAQDVKATLDLGQLARLLHLSAGVVRVADWKPGHNGKLLMRASGSAGGRYPLELYVAVPEGHDLPAGVHWYDPEGHALLEVGPPPLANAAAFVVTGVPWRTGWKYRERGYRHIYWDAGSMLAQLLALADSAGLAPHLITSFPDAELDALVGANGIHEFSLAVVSLGAAKPELSAADAAVHGAIDRDPVDFPLVTEAQDAGVMDSWGEPWPGGEAVAAPEVGLPVEEVVLRRSSQRLMDRTRGLSRSLLTVSMAIAMRGVDVPHWVVVHDVEGLAAGLYRWPDLYEPLRVGDLRNELYYVGCDQGLPRDAAFVVVSAIRTAELDDRSYREAQLAAGLVEGRLHLAAYAQGASASGMTFRDLAIPELLGEPLDGLLLTCVGVPEYLSKRGGPPLAPTMYRQVSARADDQ